MKDSLPRIPYEIIQAAVNSDEKALKYILDVFYPYIEKLATKSYFDEFGYCRKEIDYELIAYIQSNLIMEIVHRFRLLS